MHVGAPTGITLSRESRQLIKTTTCSRKISELDLQPSGLNNPFGLKYPVPAFQNEGLPLLQNPLSIRKSAAGRFKPCAAESQLKGLTRERWEVSDSNFSLSGAHIALARLEITRCERPKGLRI
jgi:hypothetical protein